MIVESKSRNPRPVFLDILLKMFSRSEQCTEQTELGDSLKNMSVFGQRVMSELVLIFS